MGKDSKRKYAGGREQKEGCGYEIRRTREGGARENEGECRAGWGENSAETWD
jgi:hypothetical protein